MSLPIAAFESAFSFTNPQLLVQALTHRSYAHETGSPSHNERLELLGDSVLNLIVVESFLQDQPQATEGEISKWRSAIVSEAALAEIALWLGLDQRIKLGRGELNSGTALSPRVLASCFEALVAAIYLDAGLQASAQWVLHWFKQCWPEMIHSRPPDHKSVLQELVQQQGTSAPTYRLIEESGPSHQKWFTVEVYSGGRALARGEGKSKKMAEQNAAERALEFMREDSTSES